MGMAKRRVGFPEGQAQHAWARRAARILLLPSLACSQASSPPHGGFGRADVTAVFNHPPEVVAVSVDPPQLSATGPTEGLLTVTATDPERDPLGFAWSTDPLTPCSVAFNTPAEATTHFLALPDQPGAGACTFLVTVNDGSWPGMTFVRNHTTAALVMTIRDPLDVGVPPHFGVGYQSDDNAEGGRTIGFAATSSDPAGGALEHSWSASSGTPPTVVSAPLLGLGAEFTTAATWTVPQTADGLPDTFVVSVSAKSSLSLLSSNASFFLSRRDTDDR